jgi:hypothetical protein
VRGWKVSTEQALIFCVGFLAGILTMLMAAAWVFG